MQLLTFVINPIVLINVDSIILLTISTTNHDPKIIHFRLLLEVDLTETRLVCIGVLDLVSLPAKVRSVMNCAPEHFFLLSSSLDHNDCVDFDLIAHFKRWVLSFLKDFINSLHQRPSFNDLSSHFMRALTIVHRSRYTASSWSFIKR